MRTNMWIVLMGTMHLSLLTRGSGAQVAYSPFEFQVGVQAPLTSVRYWTSGDNTAHVSRTAGVSIGMLVYSHLEDHVAFRIRGDLQLNRLTGANFSGTYPKRQAEYSIGVDASPRFSRMRVRDAELRFYAGTALRLIQVTGTDCVLTSPSPWCGAIHLMGSAGDIVGRAGWFVRRASKASMLRLDLGYQFGTFSLTRHELLIRVGLGSY